MNGPRSVLNGPREANGVDSELEVASPLYAKCNIPCVDHKGCKINADCPGDCSCQAWEGRNGSCNTRCKLRKGTKGRSSSALSQMDGGDEAEEVSEMHVASSLVSGIKVIVAVNGDRMNNSQVHPAL